MRSIRDLPQSSLLASKTSNNVWGTAVAVVLKAMSQRILVVDDSATIRKVVSAILSRHGYDVNAVGDGQTALNVLSTEGEPFDLILLDFVMPKMNGFQFCRALRARDDIKLLPVVLMSAKSDKIREQFVLQTGAVDAITKPFDVQALVAAVENALRRVQTGWTQSTPALVLDESDIPMSTRSVPSSRDQAQVSARASAEFVARLANTVAPVLASLPPRADAAKVMEAISRGLSPETLGELAGSLRDLDMGGKVILSGSIGVVPIGAVLQLLQMEGMSGALVIWNTTSEITLTMRKGFVDLVQSKGLGTEFRLGRFFIEEGLINKDDLEAIVSNAPNSQQSGARAAPKSDEAPSRRVIGDMLVESGKVNEEQRAQALMRQSSELIYELLRWSSGRFEFAQSPAISLATKAKLAMPVASIVMEGFRRVDEWRVIEAKLGSFDAVLLPDPATIETVGEGKLARQERAVLEAVDGERTVREVIAASHLSSFDACRILFQLLEARLVRRRAA